MLRAGRPRSRHDLTDDPKQLLEAVLKLSKRVSELEADRSPPWIDFEKQVSNGGALVTLAHNFGTPVRWYVVHWGKTDAGTTPAAGHSLVMSATSDSNHLVLASYVTGKAVIRVEPSDYPVLF